MRCFVNGLIRRDNKGWAALAQLVEHIIRNDGVTGSSPVSGTTTLSSRMSAECLADEGLAWVARGYGADTLASGVLTLRLSK